MTILKAGDLKMTSNTDSCARWKSRHGHYLEWLKVSGEVFLRLPDGQFLPLESADSAVEAKQRYVNFKESDQ